MKNLTKTKHVTNGTTLCYNEHIATNTNMSIVAYTLIICRVIQESAQVPKFTALEFLRSKTPHMK